MNKKKITYILSSSIILSLLSVNQVSAEENTISRMETMEEPVIQNGVTLEDLMTDFSDEDFSFSPEVNNTLKSIYLSYSNEELFLNSGEENKLLTELMDSNQLIYKYKITENSLSIEIMLLDQVVNLKVPIDYFTQVIDSTSNQEELINEKEETPALDETEEDLVEEVREETPALDETEEDLVEEVREETPALDETEEDPVEEVKEETPVLDEMEEEVPASSVEESLNQDIPKLEEQTKETAVQDPKLTRSTMRVMAKKAIPSSGIHIVQSGDSLSKIASTYGVSMNNLIKWNNITNANVIQVGQKIILDPNKAEDKRNFKSPEEFINYFAPIMKRIANEHGLFPSVMIAQALHESGYGNSDLSTPPYYNLFGIKGSYKGNSVSMLTWEDTGKVVHLNANFRDYGSYEEAIYDYANLLLTGTTGNTTRYSRTWTVNSANYVDAVYGLILDKTVNPVKGGYATDRNYAVKVIDVIEQYDLDKYDSNELNGWHVVNGKQRYYKNGQYFTGLKKVDQTVYLFSQDGNKQYGWHKLNGKDYYFNTENGGMLTGKRKIGNTTYLFNSSGSKEYGWHRLNGKDYYFNKSNGGMLTGKRKIGNTIYLLDENGTKQYGWHSDGKNKYYFSKSTGGMLTGLRNLDGTYYFFESGKGNAVKNKTIVINGIKWRFDKHGFGKKI